MKYTQEQFISKAKEIHGNKYDYSFVDYKNSRTHIKLKCNIHGIFLQEPRNHLFGHQCPKCSHVTPIKIKMTTLQFIEKAKEIHVDKYDYSNVVYIKSNKKVDIFCSMHGLFSQEANSHLLGAGCPRCVGRLKTSEQFIETAKNIHRDKYDYSLIQYQDSIKKVKIICKKHGIFNQKPVNHLKGYGCPKCSGKYKTSNIFIEESNSVHGNKYDYSLSEYTNSKKKLKIICTTHGVFEQSPTNHLAGKGCPICKESYGELKIRTFLEKYNIDYTKNKTFDDCKNKRFLPFDFFIPKFNMCIEYDGIQHYEPVAYFGGYYHFKCQIFRDDIKTIYCLDNNIKLLRIRYDVDIISSLNFIFNL